MLSLVKIRLLSALAALIVTLTGAGFHTPPQSDEAAITVMPRSRHVVMVMEENQSYSTVVRNTGEWPSLNSLIRNGALATNYYANTHPCIILKCIQNTL